MEALKDCPLTGEQATLKALQCLDGCCHSKHLNAEITRDAVGM